MAKIQLNIDDKVNEILETLLRRTDKALFIEVAIKKAYQDKEIRELFSWIEDQNIEKPSKNKTSKKEDEKPKSLTNFDPDF